MGDIARGLPPKTSYCVQGNVPGRSLVREEAMIALKPRKDTEIVIRLLLVVVILFNALAISPAPVQADQETVPTKAGQLESRSIPNYPTFERPEPKLGERISNTDSPTTNFNHQTGQTKKDKSNDSVMFIENVSQFDKQTEFSFKGQMQTFIWLKTRYSLRL
jgi:hypothetical protein